MLLKTQSPYKRLIVSVVARLSPCVPLLVGLADRQRLLPHRQECVDPTLLVACPWSLNGMRGEGSYFQSRGVVPQPSLMFVFSYKLESGCLAQLYHVVYCFLLCT